MEISYVIDKEKKIIIETWPEKLIIEDYYNVKEREFNDPDFDKEYDVITDLRKVSEDFDETLIGAIIEFMKNNSDKMKNRKSAVVADSPQIVASALFFNYNTKDLNVEVSVFSTFEAALKWIKENW